MIKKLETLLNTHNVSSDDRNELISDLLILFSVSNNDAGLPELTMIEMFDRTWKVYDLTNNATLYNGTETECEYFIKGFSSC